MKKYNRIKKKITKCELLIHKSCKYDYNQAVTKNIISNRDMYNFCRAITKAGKEVLTREDTSYLDSFEYNKDNLLSLINKRNKILLAASSSDNPELKQKCIDARNNVKDVARAAKNR